MVLIFRHCRVIRHIRDFGAVFLCDERFASYEARSHLPEWMRSSVRVYDSFGPVVKTTTEFFRTAQTKVCLSMLYLVP